MKIDAEGAEALVREGMQKTLRRFPNVAVVFELHLQRDPSQTLHLLHQIERAGYALRSINYEGAIVPAEAATILAQPREHWTLRGTVPSKVACRLNSSRLSGGKMIGSVRPSTANRPRSAPEVFTLTMPLCRKNYDASVPNCLCSRAARAASRKALNASAVISSRWPQDRWISETRVYLHRPGSTSFAQMPIGR